MGADDEVRVWVKTSIIEEVLYGKVKTSCLRRSIVDDVNNSSNVNWGWARGHRIRETSSSAAAPLKVYINDEESDYDQQTIIIPNEKAAEAVVMDNVWEEAGDEDDSRYGHQDSGGPPEDLIQLTHLHEPAVVHCLRKRYQDDKIYTATGPILLALNPFKNLASWYSSKVRQQYVQHGEQRSILGDRGGGTNDEHGEQALPPHVYGLADNAFRTMMKHFETQHHGTSRGTDHSQFGQSILVSGESGSGKTVTTKFILQYLASLSERCSGKGLSKKGVSNRSLLSNSDGTNASAGTSTIEQQVLQSNPILESFGNARTIRNDNSSRFGKFIELTFHNSGILCGASIETYLLEKVRLVHQMPGERNYHIFYELLVGLEDDLLDKYYLIDKTPEDFRLTNSSGTYDRRDGVDDYDTFTDLKKAMNTMGFSAKDQENILSVTAALLHCSNLEFIAISADECEIDRDSPSLEPILSLLGFTADALNRALCYFSIKAGKETHTRSLSKASAAKGLLGFIKATYGALFSLIVSRVNSSIHVKENGETGRGVSRSSSSKKGKVGVLDIFGFESFKKNSFEQLCINYCNEALQQQFNLFVLKKEQEEYQREGIQWSYITFPDNQDVLDLIYKKGAGILNILDDQCRAPGTTDKTFSTDLYKKCTGHARFQADFRQVGSRLFGIFHYAGAVEYDTEGFVEKNRDEVPREATELLQSSGNDFVQSLGEIISIGSVPTSPAAKDHRISSGSSVCSVTSRSAPRQALTVGSQFAQQLTELRQKIDSTCPHYVRCLKPNDLLIPDHFDPVIIADQLRCAGVIEAVRVSRVGYPQRYTHANFLKRYKTVALKELKQISKGSRSRLKPCDALVYAVAKRLQDLDHSLQSVDSKENGTCNTFFWIWKSEIDLLAVGIQIGKTKIFLRAHAYELIEHLRHESMDRSTIKIQSVGRMRLDRRSFLSLLKSSLKVQGAFRIFTSVNLASHLRRNHNSTVIQRLIRMHLSKRDFVAILLVSRWLQVIRRTIKAKQHCLELKQTQSANLIQKWCKMSHWRGRYQISQRSCIVMQCTYRYFVSKSKLVELRLHQRDLTSVTEERDMLRKEVQTLRDELEKAQLSLKQINEESNINDMSNEIEILRKENEDMRSLLKESETQLIVESERLIGALKSAEEASEEFDKLCKVNENICQELQEAKRLVLSKEDHLEALNESILVLRKELEEERQKNINEASCGSKDLEKVRGEFDMIDKELQVSKILILDKEEVLGQRSLELNNDLHDSQSKNEQLLKCNQDLEKQLAALSSQLMLVGDVDKENGAEVERLSNELAIVKNELQEYQIKEKEINFSDDAMNGLKGEIFSLQGKLAAELRKNNEIVLESTVKLREANDEVLTLQAKVKELEQINENQSILMPSNLRTVPETGSKGKGDAEVLQDEVLRLKEQLKEMTKVTTLQSAFDPNSPEHLLARYEELRKLSEANVMKDHEIDGLRQENMRLQDQLDSQRPDYSKLEVDDASSLGFFDAADGRDSKKEMDPFFFLRRNGDLTSPVATNRTPNREQEDALKVINEFLRAEVESLRKKLEAADKELAAEKKKSAEDLAAFSEALHGVDKLRAAAEGMSRELARVKRRDKFNKMVSGKWETMSLQDDNFSILSGGTSLIQDAQEKLSKSGKPHMFWSMKKK